MTNRQLYFTYLQVKMRKDLMSSQRIARLLMIDPSLFIYDEEKTFFEALRDAPIGKLVDSFCIEEAVQELARLGKLSNSFMDKCNIIKDEPNVEESVAQRIRNNRKILCQIFVSDCEALAALSKLEG